MDEDGRFLADPAVAVWPPTVVDALDYPDRAAAALAVFGARWETDNEPPPF